MIAAYNEFRDEVIRKYHADYGCGQSMPIQEIQHEFDMTIGKSGYDELCRVDRLCESCGEPHDAVKRACEQMDMLI